MAYKLDNTGRYVDSSGKKYDAASGWTASKDGKTLTNSYTGQTVTDAGSTKSSALSSTGTSNTVTKTASSSKKTSPRQVTYTSGSKSTGSGANTNTAVTNANAAIANTPQMDWTVKPKTTTAPTTAPTTASSAPASTPQMNWTVKPETTSAPATAPSPTAAWAVSADGKTYQIDSDKAWSFINNQPVGSTMIGGDGSKWVKNSDGSVTISKNGQEYTYRGAQSAAQPIMPAVQQMPEETQMLNEWTPMANIFIPQAAYSLDGSQYSIDSDFGDRFLATAKPGETMIGGDGSRWTKNEDGSVTIIQNGKRYTYAAGMQTGIYADPFEYTPFEQTEMGQSLLKDYQDLQDKINNYDAFNYNPNNDPLYLQYADSYTRSGQRAMTDVLGQLAARTGGMASSYAGYMAQQAYDDYMADLAGKIPELSQLAYSMYVDDYNRLRDRRDTARTNIMDAYDRYGQDLNFRYGVSQDELANRWKNLYNTQDMYQQGINNYNYAQNYALQQAATERANRLEDERIQREIAETEYEHQQDTLDRQQVEQERADRQAELEYNRRQDIINDLWDQVNRYGRIPQLNTVLAAGLTYQDYEEMVAQAKHVRAADASKYYGGW